MTESEHKDELGRSLEDARLAEIEERVRYSHMPAIPGALAECAKVMEERWFLLELLHKERAALADERARVLGPAAFGWTPEEAAAVLREETKCHDCQAASVAFIGTDDRDFVVTCGAHFREEIAEMMTGWHGAALVLDRDQSARYESASPVSGPAPTEEPQ